MISWYIGFNRGFDFSLGKNYKFINKYLTDKEFNMLLATFEMNGYRKTYQSFKLCCELFKYYSNKVSCLGNYNYPNYEKNIENFMADELNIPGFKHYELDSTYQAKLAAGEVNAKDLSFVKETGKIYTQGGEYGGGSGECVTDKFIRTLYGPYEELTDEQRAYNVETFNMYGNPNSELPTVVIGGRFLINIDNINLLFIRKCYKICKLLLKVYLQI